MTTVGTIAPHIFLMSAFLSLVWGVYLVATALDYRAIARSKTRTRADVVRAMRRLVLAFCIWSVAFAYVFRTTMVLIGFSEDVIGQVVFFALLGTNVVGSLFAIISLRYD